MESTGFPLHGTGGDPARHGSTARFSRRLAWHEAENPLAVLLARKRAAGDRLLDLTQSNPTQAALPYPVAPILDALSDSGALTYQPTPRGLDAARAAVAAYYRDLGVDLDPSRILLTASTSEAYAYLFKLLCDPGDEILSPRPSYPLFEFLAGLEAVRVSQYPLRYDGVWHIDFAELETRITSRTRAIVTVNPNNPTGSFLKREERERLDSIAAERGLAILSDEVFCDYGFGSDPQRVRTLITPQGAGSGALTFSMSGLSKIAGLPQMKLGWIVASGPEYRQALDALELVADTYLSVAAPVQVALPRLLAETAMVRTAIQQRTADHYKHLQQALDGSDISLLRAEGGWYAVLRMPATRSEEQWALDLLDRHNVVTQPGFFFDFETEPHLVVSLLTEPPIFAAGLQRVLGACGGL